jgi:hypothetical protein
VERDEALWWVQQFPYLTIGDHEPMLLSDFERLYQKTEFCKSKSLLQNAVWQVLLEHGLVLV